MRIEKITPLQNHILHVLATDGREGVFDMQPYLDCEAFKPLNQPGEFFKVRNGGYFVEWECGADLSADTLESGLREANLSDTAAQRPRFAHL